MINDLKLHAAAWAVSRLAFFAFGFVVAQLRIPSPAVAIVAVIVLTIALRNLLDRADAADREKDSGARPGAKLDQAAIDRTVQNVRRPR